MLQNPHHSQPEVRRATSKTDAGPIGAKKLAQHRPSTGISVKKFALYATKRRFWAIFRTLGELFRAHAHHQIKQGELFRAQDPARGDFATNDTSAATDAGQHETTITSAAEKRTQNAHFSAAKAPPVSVTARPAPTKATTVSTPHRHKRAKAMAVSDNRAAWSAEPGCGARGRRLGQSAAPVGNIRYKRRQTGAV